MGAELAARLEREQAGRLRQDLEAAGTQLRHLMSIAAWTQAEEIVTSLGHRYPEAPEIAALGEELGRERDTAERESYQRLVLDLKDATDHKQWRRAALAGEELVRRFPNEPKVMKLKANDLDTLKENADAQERREEEALFKDLLHRQRYDEAYTVAQRVISKFPNVAGGVGTGEAGAESGGVDPAGEAQAASGSGEGGVGRDGGRCRGAWRVLDAAGVWDGAGRPAADCGRSGGLAPLGAGIWPGLYKPTACPQGPRRHLDRACRDGPVRPSPHPGRMAPPLTTGHFTENSNGQLRRCKRKRRPDVSLFILFFLGGVGWSWAGSGVPTGLMSRAGTTGG